MKKALMFVCCAVALVACQKKEGPSAKAAVSNTSTGLGAGSVAAVKDTDLVLKPTPEQVAKAHRVGNKHCPTDGEKLGSMGKPVPVIYKGELVELCCAGCPEEFAKDPAKYLAIAKADAASN